MSVVSQTEPQHDFAGTIYIYNISGWNKRRVFFCCVPKGHFVSALVPAERAGPLLRQMDSSLPLLNRVYSGYMVTYPDEIQTHRTVYTGLKHAPARFG